jgi:hypothetical protein
MFSKYSLHHSIPLVENWCVQHQFTPNKFTPNKFTPNKFTPNKFTPNKFAVNLFKGAEYNAVIAFALLQDYVPYFSDENGEESARKLLYVISSRAKKNLHLILERGRFRTWGRPPQEYIATYQLSGYNYQYGVC